MRSLLNHQMEQKNVLRENEIKEKHDFENKLNDLNKVKQDEIKQKAINDKKRAAIHWQEELERVRKSNESSPMKADAK